MKNTYFLNGKPVDGQIALKSYDPEDVGVFETLRVYNSRIFREEEHLERLCESVQTAAPAFLQPHKAGKEALAKIRREVRLAVQGYGKAEAVLRVTWTPAGFLVMIGERRAPQDLYETGVTLKTSPVKRSLSHAAPPEAKTTDYTNALFATLEPRPAAVYEWVFLDSLGYVTEVRIGNLFIVDFFGKKPRLRTPPLQGILNGVTRRFVIECALFEGLEVREEPLTRHEIYTASETFLTNTSWEILPVRSLDAREIGRQMPGPVTTQLHRCFRKKVQSECPPLKSKER